MLYPTGTAVDLNTNDHHNVHQARSISDEDAWVNILTIMIIFLMLV